MRRCYSERQLPDSALKYVLEGLVPYTEANLKLSFTTGLFFNELDNIGKQKQQSSSQGRYSKHTLKNAYYKAKRDRLIYIDESGRPQLTARARQRLKPYRPGKLGRGAYLIVSFDIPERRRRDRDHFRYLLKELGFAPIQKSVWKTDYDHRQLLKTEIEIHQLWGLVNVYEADRVI